MRQVTYSNVNYSTSQSAESSTTLFHLIKNTIHLVSKRVRTLRDHHQRINTSIYEKQQEVHCLQHHRNMTAVFVPNQLKNVNRKTRSKHLKHLTPSSNLSEWSSSPFTATAARHPLCTLAEQSTAHDAKVIKKRASAVV